MDRHAAMVRGAVALLLLSLCAPAFAYIERKAGVYVYQSVPYSTGAEACAAQVAAGAMGAYTYQVSWAYTSGAEPVKHGSCKGSNTPTGTPIGVTVQNESCSGIGTGFVANTSTGWCERTVETCPEGFTPDANGICQPPPPCVGGESAGMGYWRQGTDRNKFASLQCVSGCLAVFQGIVPGGSTLEDGVKVWYALGEFTKTGEECTAASGVPMGTPVSDVPPPDCGPGQVLGSVNEQPVCADGTTGDTVVPPKTETETTTTTPPVDNGDGTTTETSTTTRDVTNPDGTTGTQTQTTTKTCDQLGNCESTTETETTGSYVDPEDAGQEDQPSECELHPNTAGCAELDTPTGPDLPTSNVSIAGVSPQSGWGADNATCPALVHTVSLGDVDVFGLICTYMQGIRFLVIGISWLIAALIFIGRTD